MICSTLARKVFDQVDIEQIIDNAWWVEIRLQMMKINGLVKMINGSKKKELEYIDGYIPQYKWAKREDRWINITQCRWIFDLLQNLSEDFSWGLWDKLVQIPENNKGILIDAINKGKSYNNENLSYILAIFKSEYILFKNSQEQVQKHLSFIKDKTLIKKEKISKKTVDEWNNLKELL